eukprot:12530840-Ditylum_brightwellii.AAC.1
MQQEQQRTWDATMNRQPGTSNQRLLLDASIEPSSPVAAPVETHRVPSPLEDAGNREEEWDHVSASSCWLATDPPLPLPAPCANWDSLD